MKMYTRIFVVVASLSYSINCQAKEVSYLHIINETSACDNPNGNEVNRYKTIQAPAGSFIERESIKVYPENDMRSFTDKAEKSGCFIRNAKTELLEVRTQHGNVVKLPVLTSFDVYGHSDCGSGTLEALKGNMIRTDCSATVQIFTREDLQ